MTPEPDRSFVETAEPLTDPEPDLYGDALVELRLTYSGPLLASSRSKTRPKHKHDIRRVFHRQLKRFWEIHPTLSKKRKLRIFDDDDAPGGKTIAPAEKFSEYLAKKHSICGSRFVPLASSVLDLHCELDILMLRPDAVATPLIQSGDIDNRLKTLMDALRIPKNGSEIPTAPSEDEDPFYCLLEDDSLVSQVKITSDTLLEPVNKTFDNPDVRLMIKVVLRPYVIHPENSGF